MPKPEKWTRRQKQVLRLVAEGWRLRQWGHSGFMLVPPKRPSILWPEYLIGKTVEPLIKAGLVEEEPDA